MAGSWGVWTQERKVMEVWAPAQGGGLCSNMVRRIQHRVCNTAGIHPIILIDKKNHRFLRLGTIDPLGGIFHRYMHCRMFSNILGLYPLDVSGIPHIVRTQSVARCPLGVATLLPLLLHCPCPVEK